MRYNIQLKDGSLIPAVSSIQIAEWTDKDHSHVCRDIENLIEELYKDDPKMDHVNIEGVMRELDNRGYTKQWLLDEDHADCLASGYDPVRRMKLIKQLRAYREGTIKPQLPDFNNPAESARAWAERFEAEQKAIEERDRAVATKAQISDKKTATAMATASAEKRRANKLQKQLDAKQEYQTVLAMNKKHDKKFKWLPLKHASLDLGYEIKKVDCERYGEANAYHVDVWSKVYSV